MQISIMTTNGHRTNCLMCQVAIYLISLVMLAAGCVGGVILPFCVMIALPNQPIHVSKRSDVF